MNLGSSYCMPVFTMSDGSTNTGNGMLRKRRRNKEKWWTVREMPMFALLLVDVDDRPVAGQEYRERTPIGARFDADLNLRVVFVGVYKQGTPQRWEIFTRGRPSKRITELLKSEGFEPHSIGREIKSDGGLGPIKHVRFIWQSGIPLARPDSSALPRLKVQYGRLMVKELKRRFRLLKGSSN